MRLNRFITGLLGLAALAGAVHADPPTPGVSLTPTLVGTFPGKMQVVENSSSIQIQSTPNAREVWNTDTISNSCGSAACVWANPLLTPSNISLNARTDGYDLEYTFYNNTAGKMSLGTLSVSGLRFTSGGSPATSVFMRDFTRTGQEEVHLQQYTNNSKYPGTRYSPAAVFGPNRMGGTDDYYIGVSLQYDVLGYKHPVLVRHGTSSAGTLGWEVNFMLNPAKGGTWSIDPSHRADGEIFPGETRTYVVSVRFYKYDSGDHPNAWLRTLLPYREFLHDESLPYDEHGDVEYDKDPRPILGRHIGLGTCSNPAEMGYTDPDSQENYNHGVAYTGLNGGTGWSSWCTYFTNEQANCGWERFMLWEPSNNFCDATVLAGQHAFPFRMTTRWFDGPSPIPGEGNPDTTAIVASLPTLAGTFTAGAVDMTLGFWWGHSTTVQTGWTAATFTSHALDPTVSGDRTAAFNEVDNAEDVNVREIGMDAFDLTLDVGMPWIRDLQSRYNGMRFIIEPVCPDIMHRIAPTFLHGLKRRENGGWDPVPHFILADFLWPGHETWTHVVDDELADAPPGHTLADRLIELAERGWVTVLMDGPVCVANSQTVFRSIDTASRNGSIANSPGSGVSPAGSVPPNLRMCIETKYLSDFNCSGALSAADIAEFLNFYNAGDMLADYNLDGVVDYADYAAFMYDYTNGL